MRASLLVRLVCYAIVALAITPANAAQPFACAPDKYFQPFDPSETLYNEPSEEFNGYLKQARRGDHVAQYNLGISYDHGYLVTRCPEKAKFWYQKAAIGGNTDAQRRLKDFNCIEKLFRDRGERTVIFSVNQCEDRPPATVVNVPSGYFFPETDSKTYECRSTINPAQIYLSYRVPCSTGQAVNSRNADLPEGNSFGAVMGRGAAALLNIKRETGNARAAAKGQANEPIVGDSRGLTMCPDGTYVSGNTCLLAPDGRYVGGGTPRLAPDGSYVGGTPRLAPDGSYVGGNEGVVLCPDGSYVSGTRCRLTPDGKYVGG